MVFVGGTIGHIFLVFGENHLNIIPKNHPQEFYKNLISTLHLRGKSNMAPKSEIFEIYPCR